LFGVSFGIAATPPERSADFALVLSAPSVSEHGVAAQIRGQQTSLRTSLSMRKIMVTGAASTLVNAIFVRVPVSRASELQNLPGVQFVVHLPPLRRHLNRALDLIQASGAWSQVGGLGSAGAGVRIGVVDSGIDQTHPAFQGASLQAPPGFPVGDRNYTNNKVIVARSYVSQLPYTPVDPQYSLPDDVSPSDHFGHGTAIAMIAAGEQVQAPIATINGIAPKAFLGNYKIYGTPGINDYTSGAVVIQALEDALADGMNIAVLASGGAAIYGPLDQVAECASNPPVQIRPYIPAAACDIQTFAVEHAVQMGMTVVVSAGEDAESGQNFPAYSTINSPGTAPSAITVGATSNSHVLYASASVPNMAPMDALFGSAPKPGGAFTAPLADVTTTGNDGLACSPMPANSLAGAVALVARGTCYFDQKSNNAKNAGAVAVLLYSDDDTVFVPTGLEDTAMPFVLIGNTDGSRLKQLVSSQTVKVTLDPALHEENGTADMVASYSSRGPSIGAFAATPVNAIKPELVAPGSQIYTAAERLDPTGDLYDASGYTVVDGNSFSAAMVAGAAALVKQAHPGYTPAQVKSALVNTASTNIVDDAGPARVRSAGAGKLNAQAAVGATVTVSPATLSFGAIGATLPAATISVTNSGTAPVTLNLAVAQRDPDSKASLSIPSTLTVNPGIAGSFTARLTGSRPNPGSYEGSINITGGGVNLHLPYTYLAGDGIAANIFPVRGDGYTGVPGEQQDLIAFRVLDQYGVPVTGSTVTWTAAPGGGSIDVGSNGIPNADVQTDTYGAAAALVDLGNTVGPQVFTGSLGSIGWTFNLWTSTFPVINANGVVNGASFQASPVAPGSYITINGQNLAPVASGYVTVNLPPAIAATSVSFDIPSAGISVPGHLSYISGNQINVQVPWELKGQTSAQIKVTSAGISSALYSLTLSDYGPGIFEYAGSDGKLYAAAVDTNSQLITTSSPAQRGTYISIFANGMGPVTNQPASGSISPLSPLAQSVSPSSIGVTIGGKAAQVGFSGLAPYYVGLYQLNVLVPADSASGVQPVVITGNGVASKASQIAVSQ
jgi:uncharacterized protein (TIGR03437 family)